MNMNNFGHVSIVFEYDMMCACVYHMKCFNFTNIRIRTDFYIKIRIRRMRILINSVTSLEHVKCKHNSSHKLFKEHSSKMQTGLRRTNARWLMKLCSELRGRSHATASAWRRRQHTWLLYLTRLPAVSTDRLLCFDLRGFTDNSNRTYHYLSIFSTAVWLASCS